jgi:predicted O-methyltransferase YrrM
VTADPFADLHALTRAHRVEHLCGAHTFMDGPGLVALVRELRPARVLELGCALGYTACCLSEGGPQTIVDTIEGDESHVALARASIARRGLGERVIVHHGWFEEVLARLPGPYDLAFFDGFAPSSEVVSAIGARLAASGVLVCANLGLAEGAEHERLMAALGDAGRWSRLGELEDGGTLVLRRVEE